MAARAPNSTSSHHREGMARENILTCLSFFKHHSLSQGPNSTKVTKYVFINSMSIHWYQTRFSNDLLGIFSLILLISHEHQLRVDNLIIISPNSAPNSAPIPVVHLTTAKRAAFLPVPQTRNDRILFYLPFTLIFLNLIPRFCWVHLWPVSYDPFFYNPHYSLAQPYFRLLLFSCLPNWIFIFPKFLTLKER